MVSGSCSDYGNYHQHNPDPRAVVPKQEVDDDYDAVDETKAVNMMQDSSMSASASTAANTLTTAMLQHLWSSMAAAAASKQQEKFLNT